MSEWTHFGKELFAIIIIAGLTYYLITLLATFSKVFLFRILKKRSGSKKFLPPISILKPVNGVDGNLYENLLSFVNQDYPEFEIIIGIQSPDDQAIELVEQLQQQFPDKKIYYTVSDRVLGFNPKINNLYGMMPLANHDYMVISDSNVMVAKDYLQTNIKYFENKKVGIVTNLIRGIGGESVGALFENLHLNSFVIGNISLLDFFTKKIVVGKSIFFKRSQFEKLGGLWELRNYLAEDYLMGKLYRDNGYKVVISPNLICTTNHSWTMKRFINRHTRWAQLRWNLNKAAYAGELLLNFPLLSLLFAITSGFSYDVSLIAALCWAAKIIGDALMNEMLRTGFKFRHCIASPIKDLLIGILMDCSARQSEDTLAWQPGQNSPQDTAFTDKLSKKF